MLYRKAPDNHNKLVVDGETAWVVKRIFELADKGFGVRKIAKAFRTEQVACPSWWLHTRNEKDYSWRFENPENKYEWAPCVIRGIIGNPIYLGHSVMCKTEVIFKVEKYRNVPESEQIRVENTHEPLVSQELFDGANAKIQSRRRDTKNNFVSIFAGLIKCGTCGKSLGLRYWGKDKHHIYVCSTYAQNTKACSDHCIFYEDLYNAVLADIQYHAHLAFEDREKAVALALKMNAKADGKKGKNNESRLKQAKKRYEEVTRLFERLYEDSLSGRISNENFARLIDKYQTEFVLWWRCIFCWATFSLPIIFFASSRKLIPVGVRVTVLVVRCRSFVPNSFSNEWIWRETADWVIFKISAALAKFRFSATWIKLFNWSVFMGFTSIIAFLSLIIPYFHFTFNSKRDLIYIAKSNFQTRSRR